MKNRLITFILFFTSFSAFAAPMAIEKVPEPLKPWVSWVMHNRDSLACPFLFNDFSTRSCAWPSDLSLDLAEHGGSFRQSIEVFAADTLVPLPGDLESWPQIVTVDGKAVPVVPVGDKPSLLLGKGRYLVTGIFPWKTLPQSLAVPSASGILSVKLNGASISLIPDSQGRISLSKPVTEQSEDTASIRIFRLFDDSIPITSTVRYEVSVSGKPRPIKLPAAIFPSWQTSSIDSMLPVLIDESGTATVQVRAGTWKISISSRLMSSPTKITLPDAAVQEEVWSFVPHNDVRVVTSQGMQTVDPANVDVPPEWRSHQAFLARPGGTLSLTETRRGNAEGAADKLSLTRTYWLDFSGKAMTVQDHLSGTLGRTWRLELPAPFQLGRVAVNGLAQPITSLTKDGGRGVELRNVKLNLDADSRIESMDRTVLASGWRADISSWSGKLHLPPGWRLLHVSGVDRVGGAWIAAWTLWDFFFVAIVTIGAFRLFGLPAAIALGLGLTLAWHSREISIVPWVGIVIASALAGTLPEGKLRAWAGTARLVFFAIAVIALVPFAVQQVRLALYPSLQFYEQPGVAASNYRAPAKHMSPQQQNNAPAAAMTQEVASDAINEADVIEKRDLRDGTNVRRKEIESSIGVLGSGVSSPYSPESKQELAKSKQRYQQIDPGAKNLTGPGIPGWTGQAFGLTIQGPITPEQALHFYVLPPWANALWGLLSVIALGFALWKTSGTAPQEISRRAMSMVSRSVAVLLLVGLAVSQPNDAIAANATNTAPSLSNTVIPPTDVLGELYERLSAAPTCMPNCADLARLSITAKGDQVFVRVLIHAQAPVAIPLPGQGARVRPVSVRSSGSAAILRRDESGTLWASVSTGVTEVVMEFNASGLSELQLSLPMPAHELVTDFAMWSLSGGLDARGLASGSVQLLRNTPQAQSTKSEDTRAETLSPFVRVKRTLMLEQRWSVKTRIDRVAPSMAPLTVRVPLMAGEAVTDPSVKVINNEALVELGQGSSAEFSSKLEQGRELKLKSGKQPSQIEQWLLDVSPQWHVVSKGLPPVQQERNGEWLPTWMPWPGEEVTLSIEKPAAIDGATMTVDAVRLNAVVGKRTSDLSAEMNLRAGTGGNHTFTLPQDAKLLSIAVDGVVTPLRADGRKLTVPVTPGTHIIKIDWRDAQGIESVFRMPQMDLGLPAVNAALNIKVPYDRMVLLTSGPAMGPAVLIWGVLIVTIVLALVAARVFDTPLTRVDWLLLGIGVVQTSMVYAVIVAGWFLAMALRKRASEITSPWRFNAMQIVLVLATLLAASALLATLKNGLLGYPNLLIQGNSSSVFDLRWYQDRIDSLTPLATMISIPVAVYRALMLGWALWLAFSVLKWVRWAWACYSTGTYWKTTPALFRKKNLISETVDNSEMPDGLKTNVPSSKDKGPSDV